MLHSEILIFLRHNDVVGDIFKLSRPLTDSEDEGIVGLVIRNQFVAYVPHELITGAQISNRIKNLRMRDFGNQQCLLLELIWGESQGGSP